ncbi:MAG: LVIVD repeat-containing protein [bacterium]
MLIKSCLSIRGRLLTSNKSIFLLIMSSLLLLTTNCGDGGSPTEPGQPTQSITLLGNLNFPISSVTDVWGYFDQKSGKEFAVVGYGIFTAPPDAGFFLVDVTNPANPVQVANVNTVPGFDVKVWQHYVYTVKGDTLGPGAIVDVADPQKPQQVGVIPGAHNIFIDANGYMYLECPGLRIFDLNVDPTNPALVWEDEDSKNRNMRNCHDAAVIGNRLFDFHGFAGTNIYDITDPTQPQLLGAIDDPAIQFNHSGWTTESGEFLYICDELAQGSIPDITIWDIRDVTSPKKVSNDITDQNAIVHNLFVIDNLAFVSYYTAGFRVFNISDPSKPILADEFDTSPSEFGEMFSGDFGVFPFAPSGNIYVSDVENGLFIFSVSNGVAGVAAQASQ